MVEARMIELVKNHIDVSISIDLNDWSNVDCRVYAVREEIRYGANTFYIDADLYSDCYIDDMLLNIFADYVEDIVEDDELDITLEEINFLKEEYGITEEVED